MAIFSVVQGIEALTNTSYSNAWYVGNYMGNGCVAGIVIQLVPSICAIL